MLEMLSASFFSLVSLKFVVLEKIKVYNNKTKSITTKCHILIHYRYIAMQNIVRKGEIAYNKQFLLFSQCFPPYMALYFQMHFNSLPNNRILDWSKLEAFSDDKINVTEKLKFVLGRVENIE